MLALYSYISFPYIFITHLTVNTYRIHLNIIFFPPNLVLLAYISIYETVRYTAVLHVTNLGARAGKIQLKHFA